MRKTIIPPAPTQTQSPLISRTPVVEFEYPDSETRAMKTRYVRVTDANADYVKGYELEAAGSAKPGTFKSYSRNHIAQRGVALVTF